MTAVLRPWYREGWVWFAMTPPLAAILGCIATITVAIRSADGVVADDYYRRGLAINEQLARTETARRLGVGAQVQLGGAAPGDAIEVAVVGAHQLPEAATLRIALVHPGRSGADRVATLARVPGAGHAFEQRYRGAWPEGASGGAGANWRIALETPQWRLDGDVGVIGGAQRIEIASPR